MWRAFRCASHQVRGSHQMELEEWADMAENTQYTIPRLSSSLNVEKLEDPSLAERLLPASRSIP